MAFYIVVAGTSLASILVTWYICKHRMSMPTPTHLKQIAMDGLRLGLSALIGAFAEMRVEMNRPTSNSLKQIAKDDIRLYFAPFTGAIAGIKKERKRRKNSSMV